jgi:hypothetical protein
MDHAAVVPRLMSGQAIFRLEHEGRLTTFGESHGGCHAHYAAPNYYDSIAIRRHSYLL